jgi:hypothetical protein
MMAYMKSVLAGIALSLVAWFVAVVIYGFVVVRPQVRAAGKHGFIGVDVRVFLKPIYFAIALVGFAIGFYSQYR